MENSGRPYRAKKGSWERGAGAGADNWRIQDQGQGQSYRSNGKNQGGPYRASPRKGGQGPLSSSPGGFRSGQSPSQKDDLRWLTGLDNTSGILEDNWRERSYPQRWRRSSQGEAPHEDRDQDRDRNQEAYHEGKSDDIEPVQNLNSYMLVKENLELYNDMDVIKAFFYVHLNSVHLIQKGNGGKTGTGRKHLKSRVLKSLIYQQKTYSSNFRPRNDLTKMRSTLLRRCGSTADFSLT